MQEENLQRCSGSQSKKVEVLHISEIYETRKPEFTAPRSVCVTTHWLVPWSATRSLQSFCRLSENPVGLNILF